MSTSLCIATYRRPDRLEALLLDIARQARLPDEVVIVDNDAQASAEELVTRLRARGMPYRLIYAVQPLKNISITRNRTVELATGEWLAFIDDDERAPPEWLQTLCQAAAHHGADAVLGPVHPVVPDSAASWIKRGRFYEFPRMPTGTEIPPNRLRFGNVLLRGELVRGLPVVFDPAYGLTGGEDGDLLSRLALQGARLVWCDEALVHEPVEPGRLSLKWLLRRALSGGQDFARHKLSGRYGRISPLRKTLFFVQVMIQVIAAACLALVSWPAGRHVAAHWLTKVTANIGKLSALWGWRYREYA